MLLWWSSSTSEHSTQWEPGRGWCCSTSSAPCWGAPRSRRNWPPSMKTSTNWKRLTTGLCRILSKITVWICFVARLLHAAWSALLVYGSAALGQRWSVGMQRNGRWFWFRRRTIWLCSSKPYVTMKYLTPIICHACLKKGNKETAEGAASTSPSTLVTPPADPEKAAGSSSWAEEISADDAVVIAITTRWHFQIEWQTKNNTEGFCVQLCWQDFSQTPQLIPYG